ncbi:adenosylcobinamide-phosphate synthase CbiB [Alkalicoccus daliensis]|uniref:Cobalamin biosynthesis protein CobD n=1 Tax=Alkalicoccus daliensis TaxID=745820 RepID=A0A1H0HZW4_9BACI|nr:adenosylcobinamide-phosphate synthase CbiB [Alkalicoccus daliensis]SDO24371.1 adenosylcobinamide-phosphate synthase [Alkalicoccus daliensis]
MIVIYTTGFLLVSSFIVDWLIGDPKRLPHPVVGFGRLITYFTRRWNKGSASQRKARGILLVFTIVLTAWIITWGIIAFLTWIHPLAGLAASIWLTASTIACKGLKEAAAAVLQPLKRGNIVEARRALSMIVGRDTEKLDESEIVRGTVETVAENTVDGVTAPLFWALLGGAPLAMAYRAVNTLDSMVGYKNAEYSSFGWASAKFDDLVNWLPARFTSVTIWLASLFIPGSKRKEGIKVTLRDAKKHPSPNSGWSEALIAGLLGVKLGGVNYYQGEVSNRAEMGIGRRPLVPEDIERAILYLYGGSLIFVIVTAAFAFLAGW